MKSRLKIACLLGIYLQADLSAAFAEPALPPPSSLNMFSRLPISLPPSWAFVPIPQPNASLRSRFMEIVRSSLSTALRDDLKIALRPEWKTMSDTWGKGPCTELFGEWLLGSGLRLEFGASTGILYQKSSDDRAQKDSETRFKFLKYNALRPIGNLILGLGWSAFNCNVSLNYEHRRLWHQNIFSSIAEYNCFADPEAKGRHRSDRVAKLSFQLNF